MSELLNDLDKILGKSTDHDTLGFDLRAGQTWIYPTNYQVRDYQYNITQAALHKNTLVCLPTGLGKTFIAAVVMYNFYRWYPSGKIIFMAPTRPLVKQQLDACYNITAIPPNATIEMTGSKIKTSRSNIWQEKHVFFITPQILQNDIDLVLDLAQNIKCIVIDEAHKALGKHANCEAIKKIHKVNKNFRVLALSATPGSNFNSVKDVITNLLISHIEVRTNESIDVLPYVFKRKLDTFVIPITGELLSIKNKYIKILDSYTRPLLQFNIITGNCANLTKGRFVLTMKEFKEKGRQHSKYSYILKSLNICITLYHGYELLIRHGLRGFLVFFDGTISKPLLNSIHELHEILDTVRNYIGPLKEIEMLPDGTIPEVEGPVVYSHPKFQKLNEILITHFTDINDDTKVMIFCEYRESVMEIYQMLLTQRPLIKPKIFLGQGAISQAKQIQAVKHFKTGICNTLISTCIGEEGLDVGEVDLIICFDISSKSPIRMVQRMGRTGRKRDGRVVVLVTEGKEQQLLSECMVQKNNMTSLLESQPIKQYLYQDNPKMIPDNIKPVCSKMYITIQEIEDSKKKGKIEKKTKLKNSTALKSMLEKLPSKTSEEELKSNKNKSPAKVSRTKKSVSMKNQMDLRNMFSRIFDSQSSTNFSQLHKEDLNSVHKEDLSSIHKEDLHSFHTENVNSILEENLNETVKEDIIGNYLKESNENVGKNIEECPELDSILCKIKSSLNVNTSSCKMCIAFKNKMICRKRNYTITTKSENLNLSTVLSAEYIQKLSEAKNNHNPVITKSLNKSSVENSLEFFNLESTFDIFSDNSSEENDNCTEKPVIFNQSVGIFDSSKVYQIENLITPIKKDKSFEENKFNQDKDIKYTEFEDISIISDSGDESPVLNTQKCINYKQKFLQTLSQSQNESNDVSNNKKIKIESTEIQKITGVSSKCTISNKTIEENVMSPISNAEKTNINFKNMSTPNNAESHLKFWDESLFEVCDSDESMFGEECKELNKIISPKHTAETSTKIINKLETEKNEKEIEMEQEEAKDYDSDATMIYSFDSDKILQDVEEKLKIQEEKQSENLNKSVCASNINSSLLSVTKAVELLDSSKFKSLNNSRTDISENIITENKKQETYNTNININLSPVSTPSSLKNKNKMNNELLHDFENDSEEEFSLLSFSQTCKRKLQQNQNNSKIISQKYEKHSVTLRNNKDKKLEETVESILKDKNSEEDFQKTVPVRNKYCNKKLKLQICPINKTDNKNITLTQSSPLKLSKNLTKKLPIEISDSDDDFEDRPEIKISKFITPKKKLNRLKKSSDEIINKNKKLSTNIQKKKSLLHPTTSKNTNLKKLSGCIFIDNEAEVEKDENYVSDSETEENSDEQLLQSSFISTTQNILDQTDMHIKYLQSIRSPKFKPNAFKIPEKSSQVYQDVFSQIDHYENDTYMNDSFCVGNDQALSQKEDMSYLEMIEAQLENKNTRKQNKKRKRVITISDSD